MVNTRIGIIGGYGRTGSEAAKYLIQETAYDLIIGGRNERLAETLADSMGPKAISRLVDVYSQDSLDTFCRDCDIVINCTGPSALVGDRVALAALRQGVHYVDPGGYERLFYVLKDKQEEIKDKGVTFVISAGLFPGLSSVFPAHIVTSQFDHVTSLEVYYAGKDKWTFSSAYDIANGMAELDSQRMKHYESGQPQETDASMKKVVLPSPIGKIMLFPFFSQELRYIVEEYGIESARGYFNNSGKWVFLAMAYIKIFKRYQTNVQRERSANLILKAADRDMKNNRPCFMIHLLIEGNKGGQKKKVKSILSFEDTYKPTGICVAVTAQLIAEGAVNEAGGFLLPAAVNIQKFMHLFEQQNYAASYSNTEAV